MGMVFAQISFTLLMYVLGVLIMGLALWPGGVLVYAVFENIQSYPVLLKTLLVCFSVVGAYFIYGIALIFITGIIRVIFGLRLRPGEFRMMSWGAVRWAVSNALGLVVSVTFMDFILLTPLASLFYRLMGAKVGKDVQINSKYCADFSLLEISDGAVIGGHATVLGHSFERGRLILKKTKIGRNAVIGLNSVVLPGADIGARALIPAGTVLGKNTKVEPGTVYQAGREG